MNKLIGLLLFSLGAAAGSVITWQCVKTKYEKLAQEEIDSVKQVYAKKKQETQDKIEEKINEAEKQKEKEQYQAKLKELGYIREEEKKRVDIPYVISPEEFGEFEEYETISLTYYADHVLTDENDDLVEDVDDTVGEDSLTRFGEYEEDSVFVRNDRLKCDYEILLDQRNYSDVIKKYKHRVEEP